MSKPMSCDWKCKFNSKACNSDQKCNNETCQCDCKNYRNCKKIYSWNPIICICERSKYLNRIAHTSVIACDEFISFMYVLSTLKTNTIVTNVTKNYHSKKVIHCYILHTFLLVIMLLLIITITCNHYTQQKSIDVLTI